MAEVQLTILAELQLGTNPTPAQLMRTALSLVKEMAVLLPLQVPLVAEMFLPRNYLMPPETFHPLQLLEPRLKLPQAQFPELLLW